MHPDGSGRERVKAAGYAVIDELHDGTGLLCLKDGAPGIWRVPPDAVRSSCVSTAR